MGSALIFAAIFLPWWDVGNAKADVGCKIANRIQGLKLGTRGLKGFFVGFVSLPLEGF